MCRLDDQIHVSLALSIHRGLQHVMRAARNIAHGDIDQRISYTARHEIGALADCFRQLIDYVQSIAGAAEALKRNDRTYTVVPRSEQDRLSRNFISINEALYGLVDASREVIQAAQTGRLHVRGDVSRFEGVYAELMQGLNNTLHAVVTPLNEAIVDASDQQSQGVKQINVAVSQLNQVTQQTAATSDLSLTVARYTDLKVLNINDLQD